MRWEKQNDTNPPKPLLIMPFIMETIILYITIELSIAVQCHERSSEF